MIKYAMTALIMSTVYLGGCNTTAASDTAQSDVVVNADVLDEQQSAKMTADKLTKLIMQFDEDAVVEGNGVQFTLQERDIILVYDENADRMRVITPIANAGIADAEVMERMLQANYDSALDARYAVANDVIWGVFIHKLSTLTEDDFLSGVAQVVTVAETFGSSFTSGAMVFGGGDSGDIHKNLLEDIKRAIEKEKKGTSI